MKKIDMQLKEEDTFSFRMRSVHKWLMVPPQAMLYFHCTEGVNKNERG